MSFQAPHPPVNLASTQTPAPIAIPSSDVWMGSFIVSFPFLVVMAVVSYRRYKTVRRQRQIANLEKVWRLTTSDRRREK